MVYKSLLVIGTTKFSFEGHVEYIDDRTNEFREEASSWALAQPQLRYDLNHHSKNTDQFRYLTLLFIQSAHLS